MRLLMTFGVAVTLLAGCLQDIGPTGDMLARDAAKGVVNTAVQARFPGVDARPLTDCIIDNASSSEIIQIAQGAVVGANEATTNLIVQIAQRPDTVRCTLNSAMGVTF